VSNAGNHAHELRNPGIDYAGTSSAWGSKTEVAPCVDEAKYTLEAGLHMHDIVIAAAGENHSHENRPPYQVVNRWMRTA
jgi:hypothetical protein